MIKIAASPSNHIAICELQGSKGCSASVTVIVEKNRKKVPLRLKIVEAFFYQLK